jgi:hypothetical protein
MRILGVPTYETESMMCIRLFGFLLAAMFLFGLGAGTTAQTLASPYDFETSVARLEASVAANCAAGRLQPWAVC